MTSQPPRPWLEVKHVGPVTVVTFTQRYLFHEEEIDVLGEELTSLVEGRGCRRLVLNFRAVAAMSSHMLGELIVLYKKLHQAGGRLALCEFDADLRQVFEDLRLDQIFALYETEQEAVERLSG